MSFDYVQIVRNDDWGLVGIIPNNGAGDTMRKMADVSTDKDIMELMTIAQKQMPKILIEVPEVPVVKEEKVVSFTLKGNNRVRNSVLTGFGY